RVAARHLRRGGARLARYAETVASSRVGDADHGHRHYSCRRVRAYGRLVRFLDGAGADVALDDLRTVFRRRRDLQRRRRAHHRDDAYPPVPPPRGISPSPALSESRQAAADDEPALGLLHFLGTPD